LGLLYRYLEGHHWVWWAVHGDLEPFADELVEFEAG
jgi:hypothetical protein